MKSHSRILIAFLLNLLFSAFELMGGIFTGSVAILSDALHDFSDAASIGISYFLEKKAMRKPDDTYTYGYARYSLLGSVIMTLILIAGSALIIYKAVLRIANPAPVNYNGMLVLSVIGLVVNLVAAIVTHKGHNLNEKAVNLHMLEDVLGWAVVLVGAVVMKFTDLSIIDPLLSLAVAVFVLINASKTLWQAVSVFLEKTPKGIELANIAKEIADIKGITDVHHLHLWSIDGNTNCATMHIVVNDSCAAEAKMAVRTLLRKHNINHATIETENANEKCEHKICSPHTGVGHHHSHHCHHH